MTISIDDIKPDQWIIARNLMLRNEQPRRLPMRFIRTTAPYMFVYDRFDKERKMKRQTIYQAFDDYDAALVVCEEAYQQNLKFEKQVEELKRKQRATIDYLLSNLNKTSKD